MKLDDLKRRLTDEPPEVLWAYKTTARTSTEKTLFSLTYGYEVMVPVEIGVESRRRENYDSDYNFILQ